MYGDWGLGIGLLPSRMRCRGDGAEGGGFRLFVGGMRSGSAFNFQTGAGFVTFLCSLVS